MCVLIKRQGQAGSKHPSSQGSQIPAEIKSVPRLALSLENVTVASEILSNPRVKFPHEPKIKELAPFPIAVHSLSLTLAIDPCHISLTPLCPGFHPSASVGCQESPAGRKGEDSRSTIAPGFCGTYLLVPSHFALIWSHRRFPRYC